MRKVYVGGCIVLFCIYGWLFFYIWGLWVGNLEGEGFLR